MRNKEKTYFSKNSHLTVADKNIIQAELRTPCTAKAIAEKIGKDPTTISKHVKANIEIRKTTRKIQSRAEFCSLHCTQFATCKIKKLCNLINCQKECRRCPQSLNIHIDCPEFNLVRCKCKDRWPYCCNSCEKCFINVDCGRDKHIYLAKAAIDKYEDKLHNSRSGMQISEEDYNSLNKTLYEGIKKGQSIYAILNENPEIQFYTVQRIYQLIREKKLSAIVADLIQAQSRKPRKFKGTKRVSMKRNPEIEFLGLSYESFLRNTLTTPPTAIFEMDCVESARGSDITILTLVNRGTGLLLAFQLEKQTADNVISVIDGLENRIGLDNFKRLFPFVLTDRGSEFTPQIDRLRCTKDGELRFDLYFCDPQQSWQKGRVEETHTLLRRILPKGTLFGKWLTQDLLNLICSHINCYAKKSLGGSNSHSLTKNLHGREILDKLELLEIESKDINLKPDLQYTFRLKK